ncbi:MAG: hypothetical protein RLY70_1529 [Planctomycetota bacterium]
MRDFQSTTARTEQARTKGLARRLRVGAATGLALGLWVVVLVSGCQRGNGAVTPAGPTAAVSSGAPASSDAASAEAASAAVAIEPSNGAAGQFQTGRVDERLPLPNAEPSAVVHAFLEASRAGQDDLAMELLSTKAREATGREGLALDRAGKASMVYEVGAAEFPAEDKQACYVPSIWREPRTIEQSSAAADLAQAPNLAPSADSSAADSSAAAPSDVSAGDVSAGDVSAGEAVQVTWILRRQSDGWRIAGMATATTGEEPLLINFEDPSDLRRIKGEVSGEP